MGAPTGIAIARAGAVLHLTLNRPEVRNAMSLAMVAELRGRWHAAEQDGSHPGRRAARRRRQLLRRRRPQGHGRRARATGRRPERAGRGQRRLRRALRRVRQHRAGDRRGGRRRGDGRRLRPGLRRRRRARRHERASSGCPRPRWAWCRRRSRRSWSSALATAEAKRLAVTGGRLDARGARRCAWSTRCTRRGALDARVARACWPRSCTARRAPRRHQGADRARRAGTAGLRNWCSEAARSFSPGRARRRGQSRARRAFLAEAQAATGHRRVSFVEDPRRQPRRDRLPRHPHRAAAGLPHRRGLQRRRRRRAARRAGRRGGAHRRRRRRPSRYLNIAALLDAARRTGADAVHPGYGFLSERADFAQACADAGLVFIGPPPAAIPRHGRQGAGQAPHARRRRALRARLPRRRTRATTRLVAERRDDSALPLLVKAVAGGGGRGMRLVQRARRTAGGDRRRAPRGQQRLRRRHADARAPGRGRPPHRGPGLRRRARQRRAPGRARLHRAAPAPEGDRGGALAGRRPRMRARMGARRRGGRARPSATWARAPSSSSSTADRRPLLPRDEHAAAGRAPGHRVHHRPRPRRVAAARSPPASRCRCTQEQVRFERPRDRGAAVRRRPIRRLRAADRPRARLAARGCASSGCAHRPRHRRGRRRSLLTTTPWSPSSIAHGRDRADAIRRLRCGAR